MNQTSTLIQLYYKLVEIVSLIGISPETGKPDLKTGSESGEFPIFRTREPGIETVEPSAFESVIE